MLTDMDQRSRPLLPSRWETARLVIQDSTLEVVPQLHEIFTACSYLGAWDPTFQIVPKEEIAGLVSKSLHPKNEGPIFRLQGLFSKERGRSVGYFHLSHEAPQPGLAWISMFVVHPDFQGQKFASEVVNGVSTLFQGFGYSAIQLRVYLRNLRALRFWVSMGFRRIIAYEEDATRSYESLKLEKRLIES
jgi:ribosomal protein S18 acetylase RimI-like enzyme